MGRLTNMPGSLAVYFDSDARDHDSLHARELRSSSPPHDVLRPGPIGSSTSGVAGAAIAGEGASWCRPQTGRALAAQTETGVGHA